MRIAYENRCAARDVSQKSSTTRPVTGLKKKSKSSASRTARDKRKRKGVEKKEVKKTKIAEKIVNKNSGTPPAVFKKKMSCVAPPVLRTVNKATFDGCWPEQANEAVIEENTEVVTG